MLSIKAKTGGIYKTIVFGFRKKRGCCCRLPLAVAREETIVSVENTISNDPKEIAVEKEKEKWPGGRLRSRISASSHH